nr:formate/nitrite transporter family protein [Halorientalis sp. IM1011]
MRDSTTGSDGSTAGADEWSDSTKSDGHAGPGAPAAGAVVPDRFETHEVFQRIIAAADVEATTGARKLFFSGLAAGFAITLTFLLYASLTASTGGDPIGSAVLYPLGFVFIVVGGYQLYTENTLPPVVLVLERLASFPRLFWTWAVVLAGNFTGGGLGGVVLSTTGVFPPEAAAAATAIATEGIETPFWDLLFKGAFAGLIVAGVVWLVYAVRDAISRVVLVYVAFLAIPTGNLFHVVVSFTEVVYLTVGDRIGLLTGLSEFVLPVLLGNTLGGVVLVAVVNYFQTTEQRLAVAREDGVERRLSRREWLLGRRGGRSYVPRNGRED